MQRRQFITSGRSGAARRAVAGAAVFVMLALGGCAVSREEYMGIPLVVGDAPLLLQMLAAKARDGDKKAQYVLGLHFERGVLVPVDLERARALYAEAARDTGGTIWVYVPPVGKQGNGQVMPVNTGPAVPGLPEARARLKMLRETSDNGRKAQ